MLKTYSEYIERYLAATGLCGRPCPGEHHFVSTYLVPRLYEINQRVPDYINPDGTKDIVGDIVYYGDKEHQFGIEVKLETVRLTRSEFNDWIVASDSRLCPHIFIGIGTTGIGLCPWAEFRNAYIESVKLDRPTWTPSPIADGYGPSKSVNVLIAKLGNESFFPKGRTTEEAGSLEVSFMEALQKAMNC